MSDIQITDIDNMAAQFWLKEGKAPTHLMLTPPQHDKLSKLFRPKENINKSDLAKYMGSTSEPNPLASICISNGKLIEIIRCVRYSQHHELDLPKLVRF